MSGAESTHVNPHYTSGKLPNMPYSGPFTMGDKYGNDISLYKLNGGAKRKHKKKVKKNNKTMKKGRLSKNTIRTKRTKTTKKHMYKTRKNRKNKK
jgi:hypothetical protein